MTKASNPGERPEDEGLSVVQRPDGGLVSLARLIEEAPEYYLGKRHLERFGLDTGILVKYLDSAIRLHFQVHPTSEFSRKQLGVNKGKTEAYLILSIREEIESPYIYAGFQRPPTREQLRRWIESQDMASIEACFDKIPVTVGDVFLIPGGCPHALGEGILMVELMEASDLVVRFEYERAGQVLPEESRFMGRELDFGLSVFDLEPKACESFRCSPQVLRIFEDGSEQRLLIGAEQTDRFVARESRIRKTITKEEFGFYIGVVSEGSGAISLGEERMELRQYDRFFVAAEAGEARFETEDGLVVLELAAPEE